MFQITQKTGFLVLIIAFYLTTHFDETENLLQLRSTSTIKDVKKEVQRLKRNLNPDRQSVRLEAKGKTLKDEETLQGLGLKSGGRLYVKDLGPQIGWITVFLAEYAGPLFIYLAIYQRPWLLYGDVKVFATKPVVQ